MCSSVCIQLIFLCAVNIIFIMTGLILNSLVLLCFWKSSHLRKKLCHFMIMVLSCFDLLAVLMNHPIQAIFSVVWLTENYEVLSKLKIYMDISKFFLGCSIIVLLVMSFERYLSAAYPIFHRAYVTKRKLLNIVAVLLLFYFILVLISTNDLVISGQVGATIFFCIISPQFLFVNYKLFKISKGIRRNAVAHDGKQEMKLKNISSCFLAVACFVVLLIPTIIFIAFGFSEKPTLITIKLSWLWTKTIISMNSTYNCLIFFWKNKILRMEAIRIINMLKERHR